MKKIFYLMLAMLLVMPFAVNAAIIAGKEGYDVPKDTEVKEVKEDGTVTKEYKIYVNTEKDTDEVTSFTVKFRKDADKGSKVTAFTCKEVAPFKVTQTKDDTYTTCEFSVPEGTSGQKATNKKVQIGTVTITIPDENSNCDFISSRGQSKGNVETGAFLNVALVLAGVAGVVAIYSVTKSKRKMFSI